MAKTGFALIVAVWAALAASVAAAEVQRMECRPTTQDALGPFYEPGAPERSRIGSGYTLSGTVKSARDCGKVPGAVIEFWQAAPDGHYDDAHRAKVRPDETTGRYRLETSFPPPYSGRPSHIHVRVTAPGFRPLVTQHYPKRGDVAASADLVLIPEAS